MEEDKILDAMDKKINRLLLIAAAAFFMLLTACSLPRIIIFEDPLSPQEHLNLGVAYENKGEYDLAIKEYEAAAKNLPLGYLYLGNAYTRKQDYEKAEKNYRRAIDKDDTIAEAHNNLAWLYYSRKRNLDEAEALAARAVELRPADTNFGDTLKKIRALKVKN